MQEELINKAVTLLENGTVSRVLGWKRGEFVYDVSPAVFDGTDDVKKNFVYNAFCGANLSKYLVKETRKDGKILVFLKPCDSYSLVQLIKEHRVDREKIYIVGIECFGKTDALHLKDKGIDGITSISEKNGTLTVNTLYGEASKPIYEVYLDKCAACKSKKHVIYDELLCDEDGDVIKDCGRFDKVEELEAMTPEERYNFWQNELSKCIRCNACREVCPACTCETRVFDRQSSGISQKAASDSFEEKMYHIIRAFHVAGRCTDCGECSRVCPQRIPLHLLNRKFIKDINGLYGEYQAGEDMESLSPLTSFGKSDPDPSDVVKGEK